jgi:hypothetical protein
VKGEQHVGEHIGNPLGTQREHRGNTLGNREKCKKQFFLRPKLKRNKSKSPWVFPLAETKTNPVPLGTPMVNTLRTWGTTREHVRNTSAIPKRK